MNRAKRNLCLTILNFTNRFVLEDDFNVRDRVQYYKLNEYFRKILFLLFKRIIIIISE